MFEGGGTWGALKFDTSASRHALVKVVFDLAHFGDDIGECNEVVMRIAACENQFHQRRACARKLKGAFDGNQAAMNAVIDFINDDEIVFAGREHGLKRVHFKREGFGHGFHVFGNVFTPGENPVLFNVPIGEVRMECRTKGEFACLPAGLHHSKVVDAKAAAEGTQHQTHGGCAFAFALSGVDLESPVFKAWVVFHCLRGG